MHLLNKIVQGPFERVTLAPVEELPLPAPCDHLLGEYGPDGCLRCAECHAALDPEG